MNAKQESQYWNGLHLQLVKAILPVLIDRSMMHMPENVEWISNTAIDLAAHITSRLARLYNDKEPIPF